MIYLLNSPVLTDYGTGRRPGAPGAGAVVTAWRLHSAIGHPGAVDFLSALLGVMIPVNRIRIEMQPDDKPPRSSRAFWRPRDCARP